MYCTTLTNAASVSDSIRGHECGTSRWRDVLNRARGRIKPFKIPSLIKCTCSGRRLVSRANVSVWCWQGWGWSTCIPHRPRCGQEHPCPGCSSPLSREHWANGAASGCSGSAGCQVGEASPLTTNSVSLIFPEQCLKILGRVPQALLTSHREWPGLGQPWREASHAPKHHSFSPAYPRKSSVSSRWQFAGPENGSTGPFAFVSQNHVLNFTSNKFPHRNPTQSRCSSSGFCAATSAHTPGQTPNYLLLLKIYCTFSPPSQNCFCWKIPFKSFYAHWINQIWQLKW